MALLAFVRLVCLNPCFSGNRFGSAINNIIDALIMSEVLILVLVEIGLGASLILTLLNSVTDLGLNPCFSGNRFGRARFRTFEACICVLILVLVEIGLGDPRVLNLTILSAKS